MSELCQRFFSSVFSFCKLKVTANENISFAGCPSGIRFLDYSKLAKNCKIDSDVIIFRHDVIVNFFGIFCLSCELQLLVQVSCQYHHWFWSYDNLLLQGIDQKSGNRKLFNIWRLGKVRNNKFCKGISNEMLLNAAKCQSYSFYRF